MISVKLAATNINLTEDDFKYWQDKYEGGRTLSVDEKLEIEKDINSILNQEFVYKLDKTTKNKSQRVGSYMVGEWIRPIDVDKFIYNLTNKSNNSYEEYRERYLELRRKDWFKAAYKINDKNRKYMNLFEDFNEFNFIKERYPENMVQLATCFQVMSKSFANRAGNQGRNGSKNNQYFGKLSENVAAYMVELNLGEEQDVLKELYQQIDSDGHDGGVDLTINGEGVDVKTTKRNKQGNKSYEATIFNVQLKNELLDNGKYFLFCEYIEDDNTVNFIGLESKSNVKEYWNVYDKLHKSYYVGGMVMPNKDDVLTSPYVFLSKQINNLEDLSIDEKDFHVKYTNYIKYHDALFNRGEERIVNSFYDEMRKRDVAVRYIDIKDVCEGNIDKLEDASKEVKDNYNDVKAICHEDMNYKRAIRVENGNNAPARLLIRAGLQKENLGQDYKGDVYQPLNAHLVTDFGFEYMFVDKIYKIPGHDIIIGKLENGESINQIAKMVTFKEWDELVEIINNYIPFLDEEQYVSDTIKKICDAQTKSTEIINKLKDNDWWDRDFVEVYEVEEMMREIEKLFELKGIEHKLNEVIEAYHDNVYKNIENIGFHDEPKPFDFDILEFSTSYKGFETGLHRKSDEELEINKSFSFYEKEDIIGESVSMVEKMRATKERRIKMIHEGR